MALGGDVAMKGRTVNQRGYALVLALLLVMLTGLSLLASTRLGLRRASLAAETEHQLQFEMAAESCRQTFEEVGAAWLAESMVDAAVDGRDRLPSVQTHMRLNGTDCRIIVADEQGKANINAMLRQSGRDKTASRLHELLSHLPQASRVHLGEGRPNLTSLAALFERPQPEDLVSISSPSRAVEGGVTLWGDGRLNLRTATDRTLRSVLADSVGALGLEKLVTARRRQPMVPLNKWLDEAELTDAERSQVARNVVEESGCLSLWLIAGLSGRQAIQFNVMTHLAGSNVARHHFEW